ncbi:hypothetical protein PC112_g20 [Phytophthora cactorum]|nr:hypothetical protein PC112_g20 [Phytophthora cactorum]
MIFRKGHHVRPRIGRIAPAVQRAFPRIWFCVGVARELLSTQQTDVREWLSVLWQTSRGTPNAATPSETEDESEDVDKPLESPEAVEAAVKSTTLAAESEGLIGCVDWPSGNRQTSESDSCEA